MKCKWYHCDQPRQGRSGFCSRTCASKYHVQKRRTKLKVLAVQYLGGKCQNPECGWSGPIDGFDFHHRDPEQKDFTIAAKGHTRSWKAIRAELDKCTLLCARCHRLEHWSLKPSRVILDEVLREIAENPQSLLDEINLVQKAPRSKPKAKPRTKIEWPSDEELHRMVWEKPRTKLAEDLGVSNVAIGKRCRTRGIDQPPRGYWSKR